MAITRQFNYLINDWQKSLEQIDFYFALGQLDIIEHFAFEGKVFNAYQFSVITICAIINVLIVTGVEKQARNSRIVKR